jgi:hypothetical protein
MECERAGTCPFQFQSLENIVWHWFVSARAKKKISLSGPVLQQEAKEVADKLRKTDFKASNGWLKSFRKRHCIVFSTVCGESVDVCEETVAERREKLCVLMDVMNRRT